MQTKRGSRWMVQPIAANESAPILVALGTLRRGQRDSDLVDLVNHLFDHGSFKRMTV